MVCNTSLEMVDWHVDMVIFCLTLAVQLNWYKAYVFVCVQSTMWRCIHISLWKLVTWAFSKARWFLLSRRRETGGLVLLRTGRASSRPITFRRLRLRSVRLYLQCTYVSDPVKIEIPLSYYGLYKNFCCYKQACGKRCCVLCKGPELEMNFV